MQHAVLGIYVVFLDILVSLEAAFLMHAKAKRAKPSADAVA